jgi:hypothetical protein
MNKFKKRLSKLSRNRAHALVLGSAFGMLDQVVEIYDSVFVVSATRPDTKAKNLIYKEDFVKLDHIHDIASIFVDLKETANLDKIQHIWIKYNSILFIEGDDKIDKFVAKPLYDVGWACTSHQGNFHVWELYK